jgi:hypothetical protein
MLRAGFMFFVVDMGDMLFVPANKPPIMDKTTLAALPVSRKINYFCSKNRL